MSTEESRQAPNQWDVIFDVTDEQIAEHLKTWEWGDETDPISVATLVLQEIRDHTMACIADDGETIVMGLFEHDMPLTIGLSQLVDEWIEVRLYHEGEKKGKIDVEEAANCLAFADRLEALANRLRDVVLPGRVC